VEVPENKFIQPFFWWHQILWKTLNHVICGRKYRLFHEKNLVKWWKLVIVAVTTPLLEECEDDAHTPEMGIQESSETPKTSEFDCRGQNTSPWGVLHVIGKILKCRCRKCPCMSHLDICSTSYGKKKGKESNWQFDFWPLKVRNRFDPGVWRWSATHRWKDLNENYKFAVDLIPIWGLSKELWTHKVLGVQTGTILGLLLGSPGTRSHSDVSAAE
jgi:hypothetical protein